MEVNIAINAEQSRFSVLPDVSLPLMSPHTDTHTHNRCSFSFGSVTHLILTHKVSKGRCAFTVVLLVFRCTNACLPLLAPAMQKKCWRRWGARLLARQRHRAAQLETRPLGSKTPPPRLIWVMWQLVEDRKRSQMSHRGTKIPLSSPALQMWQNSAPPLSTPLWSLWRCWGASSSCFSVHIDLLRVGFSIVEPVAEFGLFSIISCVEYNRSCYTILNFCICLN